MSKGQRGSTRPSWERIIYLTLMWSGVPIQIAGWIVDVRAVVLTGVVFYLVGLTMWAYASAVKFITNWKERNDAKEAKA